MSTEKKTKHHELHEQKMFIEQSYTTISMCFTVSRTVVCYIITKYKTSIANMWWELKMSVLENQTMNEVEEFAIDKKG